MRRTVIYKGLFFSGSRSRLDFRSVDPDVWEDTKSRSPNSGLVYYSMVFYGIIRYSIVEYKVDPDVWEDPKSRPSLGFHYLHHRSIRALNRGLYFLDPPGGSGYSYGVDYGTLAGETRVGQRSGMEKLMSALMRMRLRGCRI